MLATENKNLDLFYSFAFLGLASLSLGGLVIGLKTGRMPFRYERLEPRRHQQPIFYWALAALYTGISILFLFFAVENVRRWLGDQ